MSAMATQLGRSLEILPPDRADLPSIDELMPRRPAQRPWRGGSALVRKGDTLLKLFGDAARYFLELGYVHRDDDRRRVDVFERNSRKTGLFKIEACLGGGYSELDRLARVTVNCHQVGVRVTVESSGTKRLPYTFAAASA
jgi:hypothetical protein